MDSISAVHPLDGKRFIFIGDSFVYYGNAVTRKEGEGLAYEKRIHDVGYFYQICKANGADVEIVNWTFGGHGPSAIFADTCPLNKSCHGENHMSYLKDKRFDYVVVSGGRHSPACKKILEDIKKVHDYFRKENEKTKFVYLVSSGAHNVSVEYTLPTTTLNNLKTLESWGFIIVDWGLVVRDTIDGIAKIDTGTNYTKTSFVVARHERDGFHPNPLAGYITALMTYSAITGEKAAGQRYDFCSDGSINQRFDFEYYKEEYYKVDNTNFPEIFASPRDMLKLQELIDRYLDEKAYRYYNFPE